ncbi:MAG: hypothetical protein GY832_13625 [Chloroflexi bacterium]|nr:hypothetical protein [Chloroflexota bacterium]
MRSITSVLVGIILVLSTILVTESKDITPATATTYYVSPSGNDSNNGSIDSPWRTIAYAVEQVPDNHCTIIAKNGVYNECAEIARAFASSLLIKTENPYKVRLQCGQALPVFKLRRAKNITIEGFEFTRPNLSADHNWLVIVWNGGGVWSENITLRDNIFHDSTNNDLLRIGSGAGNILIESNMFYNQAGSDEHIDVNGAIDVVIQDNVFFNDFAGSGRVNNNDTSSFIVIKDSEGASDGVIGAQRVVVQRNVFLNWEGSIWKQFVLIGEDGTSTYEAIDVTIQNNLFLGNSPNRTSSPISVRGSKNITIRANTIVGDLPARYFGIISTIVQNNPPNMSLAIHNNIWSDPTGTMGDAFSCCDPSQTSSYAFDNNLFFNAGHPFPSSSDSFVKVTDDAHRVIGDPKLGDQSSGITVPRWNGVDFGEYGTIRESFEGLVKQYGALNTDSAALHSANTSHMPADDILGGERSDIDTRPDIGAHEANGFDLTVAPIFYHIYPSESANYVLTIEPGIVIDPISISVGSVPEDITLALVPSVISLPGDAQLTLTSTHNASLLLPGIFMHIPITATGGGFTRTATIHLLVGGMSLYLPIISRDML